MECKALKPMSIREEGFFEKIKANYDMLGADFEKEDLLHIVTAPAEVYLEEGGITNVVSNNFTNKQEIKLDMINNLLNRITASGTNEFTYQDTVYISNLLKKIGIKDVSEFMKEINSLKQETNQLKKLENLYESNQTILRSLIEENEETSSTKISNKFKVNNERNLYFLQDKILERLESSKIFEEVNKYYRNIPGYERFVRKEQITLAENVKLGEALRVKELRDEVQNKETSLYYYKENIYEEGNTSEFTMKNTTVEEKLTSAILLNLADNIYTVKKQNNLNKNYWLDLRNAISGTSNNTFERMEKNYTSSNEINETRTKLAQFIRSSEENETNTLLQIVKESTKNYFENKNQIIRNTEVEENSETENNEFTKVDLNYLNESEIDTNVNNNEQNNVQKISEKNVTVDVTSSDINIEEREKGNEKEIKLTSSLEEQLTQIREQKADYNNNIKKLLNNFEENNVSINEENVTNKLQNLTEQFEGTKIISTEESTKEERTKETFERVLLEQARHEEEVRNYIENTLENAGDTNISNIIKRPASLSFLTEEETVENLTVTNLEAVRESIKQLVSRIETRLNTGRQTSEINNETVEKIEKLLKEEKKNLRKITQIINKTEKTTLNNSTVNTNTKNVTSSNTTINMTNKSGSGETLPDIGVSKTIETTKETLVNKLLNVYNTKPVELINLENSTEEELELPKNILNEKRIVTLERREVQNEENRTNINYETLSQEETTKENTFSNEELRKQLEIINEKNLERQKILMEMPEDKTGKSEVKINAKKAFKDSIRAVSNPEELVLEYIQNVNEEANNKKKEEDERLSRFDPQTKQIFKILEAYHNNPEKLRELGAKIEPATLEMLRSDTAVTSEENIENKVKKTINESNEISEEIRKQTANNLHREIYNNSNQSVYESNNTHKKINFFHKEERDISEEIKESLEEQRENLRQTKEVTTEVVNNVITNKQVTTNTQRNISTMENVNINELVQRSMNQELGNISDKIYQQIERKLITERKRRGY